MKKRVNTYLAIAITTYCNYQCFYCKKGGESISKERETISFDDVKKIIANAYANGIVNFRITGGEPTSVSYFCVHELRPANDEIGGLPPQRDIGECAGTCGERHPAELV